MFWLLLQEAQLEHLAMYKPRDSQFPDLPPGTLTEALD